MRKFTMFYFVSLLIAMGLFLFIGCEKEVEKIVEVEKVTIKVDSILVEPAQVTQGALVTLTAQVTKNEEVGDLTYNWFADGGEFEQDEGDTAIWHAPSDSGIFVITLHVTDGEYIAVKTRLVGVDMYTPTVTPYYVGDAACNTCHSGIHSDWENTAHSLAWESLMTSGHPASYCYPCHAVGYEPQPNSGNSGYDEVPIEKFVNVQCENCHGPASDHISDPTNVDMMVSYDAENCGKCHEGEHHPYISEWEESRHHFTPDENEAHGAVVNSYCQGCHEGVAAAIRLSGDLSTFYSGGDVGRPDTSDVSLHAITCQVCHESHSADNIGQLRTVADIQLTEANGETPVISQGGSGKLCMQCHHARRGPESQIASGYAHFGPHPSPQADVLAAKSAYHGVANPGFLWAGPSHLNIQNSCKTCHINMVEWSPSGAAITGHNFEPTIEACANCHGTITTFDDILASGDFDGDGNIEGIQSETQGLLDLLEEALVADGLDTVGVGIAGAFGDTTRSTQLQREAGYNWVFVEEDKSLGIHNPDYVIQLLQQSYKHLTGSLPKNAMKAEGDDQVVGMW